MFEKENIAIDINSDKITILVGTRTKITHATILDTPRGSFANNRIVNNDELASVIKYYLIKSKIKVKDVSFVVRGEDIITRHLVMPIVKEEAMKESIDFELRQFIGDMVEEYYFDYEITNINKDDKARNGEVFIVAAKKDKIEGYVTLSKSLKLNIKAIDIYLSTLVRGYRNLNTSMTKMIKTVGLITVENESSSLTIAEWGKIALENFKDNGLKSVIYKDFVNESEYNSYLESINLVDVKDEDDYIDTYFQELSSRFDTFIQFYTSGKVKKTLDRIYVLGTGSKIKGIQQYFEVNLNARSANIPKFEDMKVIVKTPKNISLKDYLYCYGLLLRRG